MSWVTTMHTPSNSSSRRRSSARRGSLAEASTAARGSSRSRSSGEVASARASATRCAWPPESASGSTCASASAPSRSSQRWASSRAARRAAPRRRTPKATLSRADRCGNNRWSWNTIPTPRSSGPTKVLPGPLSSTRTPSVISPRWMRNNPARVCRQVVLPAPFGPTSATGDPSSTRRSTSRRAVPRVRPKLAHRLIAGGTTLCAGRREPPLRRAPSGGSSRRPPAARSRARCTRPGASCACVRRGFRRR